jgi:endonuclease G
VSRINAQKRVIAVWMPNTNAVGEQAWPNYRVSIDEIERQTGYDLLSSVSVDVQRVIEAAVDKAGMSTGTARWIMCLIKATYRTVC